MDRGLEYTNHRSTVNVVGFFSSSSWISEWLLLQYLFHLTQDIKQISTEGVYSVVVVVGGGGG